MYPKRKKTYREMLNNPRGWIFLWLITILILYAKCGRSEDGGFNFITGIEVIDLPTFERPHPTHRDDSFLPNSQVSGSAGKTSVGGSWEPFCAIGVEYQRPLIADKLQLSTTGAVFFGKELDKRQNANDPRPADESAQVFSSAEYGGIGQVGLLYDLAPSIGVGLVGQVTVISERYGWNRFGNEETRGREFHPFVSFGPRICWAFCKTACIGGTVMLGEAASFRLALGIQMDDP